MAAYRVLIVDDNHEIRRMVTASIKTLSDDIDVLDVPSAEEALFISTSVPFDLVVLDFRLPGMSGIDLVGRLRKRRPEAKIILVTGVTDQASRKQVSEADVEAYFFKPLDIATFLDSVRNNLWAEQDVIDGEAASTSQEPAQPSNPEIVAASTQASSSGHTFPLTLEERLVALKQQLRAGSVELLDETGDLVEIVGVPASFPESTLRPILVQAWKASQQVLQVLGWPPEENLQYFNSGRTSSKQSMILTGVDSKHALLVIPNGALSAEKLASYNQLIHLAIVDIQSILSRQTAGVESIGDRSMQPSTEFPAQVEVDPETRASVDGIFSRVTGSDNKEKAEGFWENLEENGTPEAKPAKDVLSYDQAQELGLAPDPDKPT